MCMCVCALCALSILILFATRRGGGERACLCDSHAIGQCCSLSLCSPVDGVIFAIIMKCLELMFELLYLKLITPVGR